MRPPEPFQLLPIKLFRTRPAFRSAHHDHRPSWTDRMGCGALSCIFLNLANLLNTTFKRSGNQLMHHLRIVTRYYVWLIAISAKQAIQFLSGDTRENGSIGDLLTIEMKDRQYSSISHPVHE